MVSFRLLATQVRFFFYSDIVSLLKKFMLPAEAPQCIILCNPVKDSIMAACE